MLLFVVIPLQLPIVFHTVEPWDMGVILFNILKPFILCCRVGVFFFIVMNMVFGNLSAVELFIPGGGTPYVMGDTYVPRF